ncbi:MAG TPA: hypothetical protein VIA18_22560 [Polyangia bacterium]|jgi:hypothetical protein|nr:hypothetical protein [Polyangia bacterium]
MTSQRLVLVFALLLGACGGNGNGGDAHAPDLQAPSCGSNHDMLGTDMTVPGVGKACTTNADCPPVAVSGPSDPNAGELLICNYPIADGCSAVGHCELIPLPACASITTVCGCNGQPVLEGCSYQPGSAGGPVGPGKYPQDCPGDGGT